METAPLTLSYGMFLGASEAHREIPGFSVSLLSPTLRAEDVPLHCHQNASFVLVLTGTYLSSADGAGRISLPSTLFFNPAGTTHRDAFELAQGQFLAVSLSDQSCRIAAEGARLPTEATAFRAGEAVETAFRLARQCPQSESDSFGDLGRALLGAVIEYGGSKALVREGTAFVAAAGERAFAGAM